MLSFNLFQEFQATTRPDRPPHEKVEEQLNRAASVRVRAFARKGVGFQQLSQSPLKLYFINQVSLRAYITLFSLPHALNQ
jgi:hypothetical protein